MAATAIRRRCTSQPTSPAGRAWFQEHGRLSSTRSKAVIKAVNALCATLRPQASALVAAFGVPETALGDAAYSGL